MVWEGQDVINGGRKLVETIRSDFSVSTSRNIVHGSDSTESAKSEIDFWFNSDEVNLFFVFYFLFFYKK